MKRVYLFSDDLLLVGRWVKLINHHTSIVERIKDLENIKNGILIINSSIWKDISAKFINDFVKNENQILLQLKKDYKNLSDEAEKIWKLS